MFRNKSAFVLVQLFWSLTALDYRVKNQSVSFQNMIYDLKFSAFEAKSSFRCKQAFGRWAMSRSKSIFEIKNWLCQIDFNRKNQLFSEILFLVHLSAKTHDFVVFGFF